MANTTKDKSSNSTTRAKFKIEQPVHSDSVRKGPYAVQRSVDPNAVVIKRRFGEGTKPLFERDDLAINSGTETDKRSDETSARNRSRNHSRSRSPRESKSPDSVHHRQTQHLRTKSFHNKTYNTRSNLKVRPRSRSPPLAKTSKTSKQHVSTEKVPYFLDEKRERDRLHRLYGTSDTSSSKSVTDRKSSRQRTKSRSRTPPYTRSKSKAYYNIRRRSCSRDKRKVAADVPSSTCKCHGDKRDNSRAPTSSTSQIYEHSSSRRRAYNDSHEEADTGAKPYQYIPIPVPVPADPYLYTAWASQQSWPTPNVPPPRFSPYAPMMPMTPGFRLPPPYVMPPYNPRMFRPPSHTQRYGANNYAPRFSKYNYRP